jgi:hypothetical protein
MDIDYKLISTINCKNRNKYNNKDYCTKLNINNINNFIKDYENNENDDLNNKFFDKNIYSLNNKINENKGKTKNECAKQCIENKYAGFSYKGDKNKCILYSSSSLDNKIDKNINNDIYNYRTFTKTKDMTDLLNIDDQHNVFNYFTETNNYGFEPIGKIKELNVLNEKECLNECFKNSDKCKYVGYLEQEKQCIFYKNKNIKKNNSIHDVYTVKENNINEHNNKILGLMNDIDNIDKYYYCNLNNGICIDDYSVNRKEYNNNINNDIIIEKGSENTNMPLYKCDNMYSTNPFCTKKYNKNEKVNKLNNYSNCNKIINEDNYDKQKKIYDNYCKKKYGNEYVFDDDPFNLDSIKKCQQKKDIMVKCKMDLHSDMLIIDNSKIVEHFNNKYTNKNIYYNILYLCIFLIIIIFIIYIYKIKK